MYKVHYYYLRRNAKLATKEFLKSREMADIIPIPIFPKDYF